MLDARDPNVPVYQQVASNATRNVMFALMCLGVIWVAQKLWPFGAKAIFWFAAVVCLLTTIQVLGITVIGIVAHLTGRRESGWMWMSNVVRIGEALMLGGILYFAGRIVGLL